MSAREHTTRRTFMASVFCESAALDVGRASLPDGAAAAVAVTLAGAFFGAAAFDGLSLPGFHMVTLAETIVMHGALGAGCFLL